MKLHFLNFCGDNPDNWEVAEFFFLPERASKRGLLTFGLRLKTFTRKRRTNTLIFVQTIRTGVHAEELKVSQDTPRIVTGEYEVEKQLFLTIDLE